MLRVQVALHRWHLADVLPIPARAPSAARCSDSWRRSSSDLYATAPLGLRCVAEPLMLTITCPFSLQPGLTPGLAFG